MIEKPLVLSPILGPNSGRQFFLFLFFSKIWLRQSLNCKLSSCTISEKANDPILKKLSVGRIDGRTDGQADGRK